MLRIPQLAKMQSIKLPRPYALIVVAHRQWRGRAWYWEVSTALLLFASLLLLAVALQKIWLQTPWQHTSSTGDRWGTWLQQWISAAFVAEAFVLPLSGVVLGAYTQPAPQETSEIKATLLTNLTPSELLAGRLLARLRIPLLCWLCSLLFWSLVQEFIHPLPDVQIVDVAKAHVVLLSALLMFASIGCLIAGKTSPGRSPIRSLLGGYLLFLLLITSLFLANPLLNQMQDPTSAIVWLLFFNPIVAVTAPIKFDLLRTKWVYDHTLAPDYPFQYPSWIYQALAFLIITSIAFFIAQKRFTKAYLTH